LSYLSSFFPLGLLLSMPEGHAATPAVMAETIETVEAAGSRSTDPRRGPTIEWSSKTSLPECLGRFVFSLFLSFGWEIWNGKKV